jgi:hypothetical protein
MVVGAYLAVLSTTVLELTDATALGSYTRLAFTLDMFAGLAAVAGFALLVRSRRMRRRSGETT